MATIERIEPNGNLPSIETGQARKDPRVAAELSQGAVTGSMFIDIGQATTEVAQTLERAHALAEETAAKNSFKIAQDSVLQRMEEDPDYSEEKKASYINELNQAKEASAKKLTLPNARNAFMSDANVNIELAGHKISKVYNKRMKDEMQANTETLIDGYGKDYATSSVNDTIGREHALLQKSTQYTRMAEAGYMTQKEAARKDIETTKQWNERLMNYQAEANPDMALAELSKPDGGFFKGIDPEARAKGLEKARSEQIKKEKIVTAKTKLIQQETEQTLDTKRWTGSLTESELYTALGQGKIRQAFFDKAMYSLKANNINVDQTPNPKNFGDTIDFMVDPKNTQDQIRAKILDQYNTGKITSDEAKKLSALNIIPTKEGTTNVNDLDTLIQTDEAKKAALNDKQHGLSAVWGMVKGIFAGHGKQTEVASKVIDEVNKNNTKPEEMPAVAKKVLSAEVLKMHPEIYNYPKEGVERVDRYGKKTRVFPDGSYKEE